MKEFLESFGVIVVKTGGLALLVAYPLIPFLLAYAGLQAVGRSLWSSGTRRKRRELADEILSAPRFDGDEFYRDIVEKFAQDKSEWDKEFKPAFCKLMDLGHQDKELIDIEHFVEDDQHFKLGEKQYHVRLGQA